MSKVTSATNITVGDITDARSLGISALRIMPVVTTSSTAKSNNTHKDKQLHFLATAAF